MNTKGTNTINTSIDCDLCHAQFNLTPGCVKEESVVLEKGSISHKVTITYLLCPVCGKRYPVIVDDESTLEVLSELRECMGRRVKCMKKQRNIPKKLDQKYTNLSKKLDFKRQKLAEKFNGATYQSDGDTIQLDYRYHVR